MDILGKETSVDPWKQSLERELWTNKKALCVQNNLGHGMTLTLLLASEDLAKTTIFLQTITKSILQPDNMQLTSLFPVSWLCSASGPRQSGLHKSLQVVS